MLFNMDGLEMAYMPHQDEYDRWRANLSDSDYNAIIEELHLVFDKADQLSDAVWSTYIPGNDWRGTVYQPIFHACGDNHDRAKLFFGQLVWEAAQLHDKEWFFIQEERDDDRPFGKTYFRKR